MTWSTTIEPTPAVAFEQAVEQLNLPQYETAPHSRETLDQFEAAKSAILAIWQSGAIGDPTKGVYSANLSGHANPQHDPGDTGMGGDVINLNVYRTTLVPSTASTEQETLSPSGA